MFRLFRSLSAAASAACLWGACFAFAPAAPAEDAKPLPSWVEQFQSARTLCRTGHLQASEASYNDLLVMLKDMNASAAMVSRAYDELAVVLKIQGRFDEAEKSYLRAVQVLERVDGHKGDRVGVLLSHLGALYVELGQLARAEQYLSDSRDLLTASATVPVFCRASLLQNLGVLAFQRGHNEEAEKQFKEATGILRLSGPEERPQLAIILGNLAQVLASGERAQESFPLLLEAESIFESMPGQYAPSYFTVLLIDASIQQKAGDMHIAEQRCDQALRIGDGLLGSQNPKMVGAWDVCASVYKAQHRGKESKQLAVRSAALKAELATHGNLNKTVDISTLVRQNAR